MAKTVNRLMQEMIIIFAALICLIAIKSPLASDFALRPQPCCTVTMVLFAGSLIQYASPRTPVTCS